MYTTAATVCTLRRGSGALSRVRTTELTGPGIVVGTGAPLLVPGTPVADLVGVAWTGPAVAEVAGVPSWLLGPVVTTVWTAVAVVGAAARWRWTARG